MGCFLGNGNVLYLDGAHRSGCSAETPPTVPWRCVPFWCVSYTPVQTGRRTARGETRLLEMKSSAKPAKHKMRLAGSALGTCPPTRGRPVNGASVLGCFPGVPAVKPAQGARHDLTSGPGSGSTGPALPSLQKRLSRALSGKTDNSVKLTGASGQLHSAS